MKDKSKLFAIILVVITILVVVLTNMFNKGEIAKEDKIEIVTNYSNFYTVDSCLYRTITYVFSQDKESLLSILDNSYKKENDIDINNVLSVFGEIEEDSIFVSKKMYYQKLNSNVTKYYVYGQIEKNQIIDDDFTMENQYIDKYFIVYLDTTNKTFAVEPYSGNIFIGGDSDE